MSKYVEIAKRENNTKRGFLIVNPYLGKHVAKNPTKVLQMFEDVAKIGPKKLKPTKTLVIGFAETATALGLHYAMSHGYKYIQTTREHVEGERDYLYFTEDHSHATEQYLVKSSMDLFMNGIDHVIFVDDEITTGNTVLHAIDALQRVYPKKRKYSVVSVLNSMTKEQRAVYDDRQIGVYYLSKLTCERYEQEADAHKFDGKRCYVSAFAEQLVSDRSFFEYHKLPDTRYVIDTRRYEKNLQKVCLKVVRKFLSEIQNKTVLVLGIEEFMYPGIVLANAMYPYTSRVKFHATTRSPILTSQDENYPLHNRYEFRSVNDKGRDTFLYDVRKYDKVFVLTEETYMDRTGLSDLIHILKSRGNEDIVVVTL